MTALTTLIITYPYNWCHCRIETFYDLWIRFISMYLTYVIPFYVFPFLLF